jgi:hypothetical protein
MASRINSENSDSPELAPGPDTDALFKRLMARPDTSARFKKLLVQFGNGGIPLLPPIPESWYRHWILKHLCQFPKNWKRKILLDYLADYIERRPRALGLYADEVPAPDEGFSYESVEIIKLIVAARKRGKSTEALKRELAKTLTKMN